MKLQTTTIESTRYIAIGDQTLNFSCEGDFFLSVGDQHFINPKSHYFEDQDKFTVESDYHVYLTDGGMNSLCEKLEELGFVFPQGEFCVKDKMIVYLDMEPPYVFETGENKAYLFETFEEFSQHYQNHITNYNQQ